MAKKIQTLYSRYYSDLLEQQDYEIENDSGIR